MSRSGQISTRVNEKLDCLSKRSNYHFIFRFPLAKRKGNEEAYEPEMLSVGPYHRGKSKYQKLEMYKLGYLQGILKRRNETSAQIYIDELIKVEEEARNCYSRDASSIQDVNEFVEMMLLDGCFIIEFLRKHNMGKEEVRDDPVFKMKWLFEILCRDMLLLENQLPFFILNLLFDMTRIDGQENLIPLAISCLNHCIAADNVSESPYIINQPENYVLHLLNLMYDTWCSSFVEARYFSDFSVVTLQKVSSSLLQEEELKDLEFIKCVSELQEYGIEFRMAKERRSWLDIKFENGVMEIPALAVQNGTESLLRNLIAFEDYMIDPRYYGKVVTDYTTFMNCLVNSSKDVKTLCHLKVIKNLIGDDEVISDMFNRISGTASLNCPWFSYRKIFEDVNKHCSKHHVQRIRKKKHDLWIAELKEKYFNTPWSIIAFLAATVLLVLTLLQTIFSIR